METKSEISIKYKIEYGKQCRIFGDILLKNNKDNFYIIINEKKEKLTPFIYNQSGILEIKLK